MSSNKYKAPRMIQARSLPFNICLGRYIKPLEIKLTKHHRLKTHFAKGTPNTIAERMHELSQKWQYMTEGDHKTFDAHITIEMLKMEDNFYMSCFGHDPTLGKLLKISRKNRCRSRKGDRYMVFGTRMSGDVRTSIGNTLINIAILKELLHRLGIKGEIIVNGDDFILYTNKPVDIQAAMSILRTMNMETEMKPSQTNKHVVEFCTNKLVFSATGQPTLLKDVKKTFGKFGMTCVRMDRYTTYLLENLHGNWQMMKTTPLGMAFKRLYYRTLELEQRYRKRDNTFMKRLMLDHRDLKYKYLERQFIYTIKEALADKEINNTEITLSMVAAFPEIMELQDYENKIYKAIRNIYDNHLNINTDQLDKMPYTRTLHINHNTRTIMTY